MTGPALLGAVRDAVRAGDAEGARAGMAVYCDWLGENGWTELAGRCLRLLASGADVTVGERRRPEDIEHIWLSEERPHPHPCKVTTYVGWCSP